MRKLQLLILSLVIFSSVSYADIVVIVNPEAKVDALSEGEVKRIYLSKLKTFPNGGEIVPIDQAKASKIYEAFYTTVVKKSISQISAYWARAVFTGAGMPPKQSEGGSAGVKKLVADNPNLIGYIEKEAVDSSVKVVLTIP